MLDFSGFEISSFDCYGTLIDWETGIFSALRPILSTHNKTIPDAVLLETFAELEAAAETEYKPYREVLRSVVRGFGEKFEFSPSEQEQQSLADSIRNWQPFADTVHALRSLKQRCKLAIISNIDDDLFATTAPKLGVEFDFITTAQQARCYKPNLEIFRLAQQRMGVVTGKWLHAGQSIYHDVVPAKSLGIATVWVSRFSPRADAGATKAASAKADAEVTNLQMLADLMSGAG